MTCKDVSTPGCFQFPLKFLLMCVLAVAGPFYFQVQRSPIFNCLKIRQTGITAQTLPMVKDKPPLPLQVFFNLCTDLGFWKISFFLFFAILPIHKIVFKFIIIQLSAQAFLTFYVFLQGLKIHLSGQFF